MKLIASVRSKHTSNFTAISDHSNESFALLPWKIQQTMKTISYSDERMSKTHIAKFS